VVTGYRTLRLDRAGRGAEARIGVLDFEGTLEVTNPTSFIEAIGHGLGRSKAFGCGLMLIRRAPMP
jgi:CRISPR system Cascade subunit CasE